MKNAIDMTPAQIRREAHEAIVRELGVVGLIRYLQDGTRGSGDYVRDRERWLRSYATVDELWAAMDAAGTGTGEARGQAVGGK